MSEVEKPMEKLSVSDEKMPVEAPSDVEPIYTSEARGSDEAGDGSYKAPYKTVMQAMRRYGKEPFPVLYQDVKPDSEAVKEGKIYDVVAKSQIKKVRSGEEGAKKRCGFQKYNMS